MVSRQTGFLQAVELRGSLPHRVLAEGPLSSLLRGPSREVHDRAHNFTRVAAPEERERGRISVFFFPVMRVCTRVRVNTQHKSYRMNPLQVHSSLVLNTFVLRSHPSL